MKEHEELKEKIKRLEEENKKLKDEVESLWVPIATQDDWQPLASKITAIRTMRAALDDSAITAIPQIIGGPLLPD